MSNIVGRLYRTPTGKQKIISATEVDGRAGYQIKLESGTEKFIGYREALRIVESDWHKPRSFWNKLNSAFQSFINEFR